MMYDLRNSSVFSARLNASSDGNDVIAGSSVFKTFAVATGKALSICALLYRQHNIRLSLNVTCSLVDSTSETETETKLKLKIKT